MKKLDLIKTIAGKRSCFLFAFRDAKETDARFGLKGCRLALTV